ncbi:MAG: hypothetical protein JWM59_4725 [Verrucomicrobiales bacterium]|nr:hypothetical protein [Verrucomicrobiales bacterium]
MIHQEFPHDLDQKLWKAAGQVPPSLDAAVCQPAIPGLVLLSRAEHGRPAAGPACGVKAEAFVNHGGTIGHLMIRGQECNPATRRLRSTFPSL